MHFSRVTHLYLFTGGLEALDLSEDSTQNNHTYKKQIKWAQNQSRRSVTVPCGLFSCFLKRDYAVLCNYTSEVCLVIYRGLF